MPPPSAFSAPQYYTPEQQTFSNQVPGMYNISNGGNMPMNNGPPPSAAPITPNITPAVRKMDDSETPAPTAGPDKKPRVEPEQEWQTPQIVSFIRHIQVYIGPKKLKTNIIAYVLNYNPNSQYAR